MFVKKRMDELKVIFQDCKITVSETEIQKLIYRQAYSQMNWFKKFILSIFAISLLGSFFHSFLTILIIFGISLAFWIIYKLYSFRLSVKSVFLELKSLISRFKEIPKIFLFIIILIPFIFCNIYLFEFLYEWTNNRANVLIIILAFCTYMLFSYILHLIVYKQVSPDRLRVRVFRYLFWEQLKSNKIISPILVDFIFASVFKNMDKTKKILCGSKMSQVDNEGYCLNSWIHRKDYRRTTIILSNWSNLIFSCMLAIFIMLMDEFNGDKFIFNKFICFFILIRLICRCAEIGFAFYKDVVNVKAKFFYNERFRMGTFVNYWKNSSLRKPERISLAIHSYFEVAVLFALSYLLVDKVFSLVLVEKKIQVLGLKQIMNNYESFLDYFIYSLSMNAFNISYVADKDLLLRVIHYGQIATTLILIILAMAVYMGLKDEMNDREIKTFLRENALMDVLESHKKNKPRNSQTDEKLNLLHVEIKNDI